MRRFVTLVLVLVVGVWGGIAYAQEEEPQQYTGCLTSGGDLTFVAIGLDPAKECKRNSAQVTWNATGPEGPQGPQGPEGPQGPAGAGLAFYTVTEIFEKPTEDITFPLPPEGVEFETILQQDTPTASCDPGDVAVSGFIFRFNVLMNETTGEYEETTETILALPFPFWDGEVPYGYTVPESDFSIAWIRYWQEPNGDYMADFYESYMRVVCADVA